MNQQGHWARALLLMPSTYGFASWSVSLLLYAVNPYGWNPLSFGTKLVFATVVVMYGLATLMFIRLYAAKLRGPVAVDITPKTQGFAIALHVIGIVGVLKYLFDFSGVLGGVGNVLAYLVTQGEGYRLREATKEITSIGVQLAYFGWIGAFFSAVLALKGRRKRFNWGLVILQFVGNLTFVDRTRPVWIGTLILVALVMMRKQISWRSVFKYAGIVVASGILLFVSVALWTGRGWDMKSGSDSFRVITHYIVGAFPYFDKLTFIYPEFDFVPERSLYPVMRIFSMIGLYHDPANPVLPFLAVPYYTNVSTFLEPYYMDGGFIYVSLAIFTYSFVLNAVVLKILFKKNIMILYFCANLIYVSFISFFVPKLNDFPVMLFGFFAFSAWLLDRIRGTRAEMTHSISPRYV